MVEVIFQRGFDSCGLGGIFAIVGVELGIGGLAVKRDEAQGDAAASGLRGLLGREEAGEQEAADEETEEGAHGMERWVVRKEGVLDFVRAEPAE